MWSRPGSHPRHHSRPALHTKQVGQVCDHLPDFLPHPHSLPMAPTIASSKGRDMNQNTDDPQRVHPCADGGSERLPRAAARILAGGGQWLFNCSSSLLVASLITGGVHAGVGKALTLICLSVALTMLARRAHRRLGFERQVTPNTTTPASLPAPTSPPTAAHPPTAVAPNTDGVMTFYRLHVLPGTGQVEFTPLFEIQHQRQPPETAHPPWSPDSQGQQEERDRTEDQRVNLR